MGRLTQPTNHGVWVKFIIVNGVPGESGPHLIGQNLGDNVSARENLKVVSFWQGWRVWWHQNALVLDPKAEFWLHYIVGFGIWRGRSNNVTAKQCLT